MRVRVLVLGFSAIAICVLSVILATGGRTAVALADEAEKKPAGPIPKNTETNCVRCHLTAGRELTEAVHTFAHSVHDRVADVSCHDCHGGNLEDDAKAHFAEFGFIGTKMSAHLEKCQECHKEQHETLMSGPHQWNHQKKLNITYPLCVDCHGNHDIGNPPAEFSLTVVCSECHRGFKGSFPEYAALTDAEDQMWSAILAWQQMNPQSEARVPAEQEDTLADIRQAAAEMIHASNKVNADAVKALTEKMRLLAASVSSKASARAESPRRP
jgi:uncharacterized coiled-coil protein SlyX